MNINDEYVAQLRREVLDEATNKLNAKLQRDERVAMERCFSYVHALLMLRRNHDGPLPEGIAPGVGTYSNDAAALAEVVRFMGQWEAKALGFPVAEEVKA